MTAGDFDLDGYLARIGWAGRWRPTSPRLRCLVAHHTAAIPFEGIDALLGRTPALDAAGCRPSWSAAAAAAGASSRTRCWPWRWRASASRRARCWRGCATACRRASRCRAPIWCCGVDLPEGPHLADVGFGGVTLTGPIALAAGHGAADAAWALPAGRGAGRAAAAGALGGDWVGLYLVAAGAASAGGYGGRRTGWWRTARAASSPPTWSPAARRPGGGSRLLNRRLTVRDGRWRRDGHPARRPGAGGGAAGRVRHRPDRGRARRDRRGAGGGAARAYRRPGIGTRLRQPGRVAARHAADSGKVPAMPRILVLYYSMYGHVETMAGAVAEGARSAGAEVTIKRVAGAGPARGGREGACQAGPGSARGQPAGARPVRRHHPRLPDPLRPDGGADGAVLGPDRRALGARRADRQGRQRLQQHGQPAWRAGDDADGHAHHDAPPRHGAGRAALQRARADGAGRGQRRHAPMARPPSPAARASGSRARTSWSWPASRAATWRRSRRSCPGPCRMRGRAGRRCSGGLRPPPAPARAAPIGHDGGRLQGRPAMPRASPVTSRICTPVFARSTI